jgi:hypothetical protein
MDDRLPRAFLFVMSSEERKGSARTPHRAYVFSTGEEAIQLHRVGETAAPAEAPTTAEQHHPAPTRRPLRGQPARPDPDPRCP